MTYDEFNEKAMWAVETEGIYGKHWSVHQGMSAVNHYLDYVLDDDTFFSDLDLSTNQVDEGVREIVDGYDYTNPQTLWDYIDNQLESAIKEGDIVMYVKDNAIHYEPTDFLISRTMGLEKEEWKIISDFDSSAQLDFEKVGDNISCTLLSDMKKILCKQFSIPEQMTVRLVPSEENVIKQMESELEQEMVL